MNVTGVNIKSNVGVMRFGLARQAFSQNPTLLGSIPRGHVSPNSISNPTPNPNDKQEKAAISAKVQNAVQQAGEKVQTAAAEAADAVVAPAVPLAPVVVPAVVPSMTPSTVPSTVPNAPVQLGGWAADAIAAARACAEQESLREEEEAAQRALQALQQARARPSSAGQAAAKPVNPPKGGSHRPCTAPQAEAEVVPMKNGVKKDPVKADKAYRALCRRLDDESEEIQAFVEKHCPDFVAIGHRMEWNELHKEFGAMLQRISALNEDEADWERAREDEDLDGKIRTWAGARHEFKAFKAMMVTEKADPRMQAKIAKAKAAEDARPRNSF